MTRVKRSVLFLMMCVTLLGAFFLYSHTAEAAGFAERAKNLTAIEGVRISTSGDKVRIVVDAADEVDYQTKTLASPGRVVVDISNAWLSPKIAKSQSIDSRFAKAVRVAQFDSNTVRIVVDTEMATNANNYDVFSLTGGSAAYRIVMDFGNLQKSTGGTTIAVKKSGGRASSSGEVKAEKKSTETKSAETKSAETKSTETKTEDRKTKTTKVSKGTYNRSPGIDGKRIALDPGHGGSDTGAIGPTGVTEKSIALRITKRLEELLKKAGATVYMTRTGDTEVAKDGANASDIDELQARVDVANDNGADIFLSIHLDSFTNSEVSGTTGYYYEKGSEESRELAAAIKNRIVKSLDTTDRGAKGSNFYVCRKTDMPAALIEVAFISNPAEEQLLHSDTGVEKAAKAIFDGIKDYFG
ncbi:hypothetical protein TAMA11512_10660 [Selenomonas sp. TAMA-11512]|uniref:N-acetylmuramoyl-L-alanine amidase n=1 Tax=Selenomonas sp. TAMA-11512 TaxID=3095337 RepID=UPI003089DB8A|nr:hypothetical protein TAMA11512_10660 [Selenomonas sp. TAMA-11512]